jgi:nitrogen fixation NifU-like protein
MYNHKVMDHFLRPKNTGLIEGGIQGHGKNPDCGDVVVITLRISEGRIEEARFASKGCAGAIACSSATTELLTGATLEAMKELSAEQLDEFLGGLPEAKWNCAEMAASAAREAIAAALEG